MNTIPHYPKEIMSSLTPKVESHQNVLNVANSEFHDKNPTHRTNFPATNTTSNFLETGTLNITSNINKNETSLYLKKGAAPNLTNLPSLPSKSQLKRSLSQNNLKTIQKTQDVQAQQQNAQTTPPKLYVNTNFGGEDRDVLVDEMKKTGI